MYLTTGVKFKP